jgi:hypothetical protein
LGVYCLAHNMHIAARPEGAPNSENGAIKQGILILHARAALGEPARQFFASSIAADHMAAQVSELDRLREENANLRAHLDQLRVSAASNGTHEAAAEACPARPHATWDGTQHGLTKEQIGRYSRQLILHNFGVHGKPRWR